MGETGCGKTSLVNLLPRFYDATEGTVLFDGVDVKEYDLTALREKIGYVMQKSELFSDTVANNIRWGKADVIVTGGSEASINDPGVGSFCGMQALSTRNDDAAHASRPFDKDRDGFVIGEGGAALVFEEMEHALKRGAKIYCEVAGGGMSADAYHMTAPHPEGKGALISMREAIRDAEMSIEDIDYVNAHGTSTSLGDVAEVKAIKGLFGEHAYKMNISSTKSMTGHLLGGTAAIEALACVMAITKGVIPPTINVENLDPEIDPELNLTLGKAQYREVRAALSNTFGFGGHNSSVIFRKV